MFSQEAVVNVGGNLKAAICDMDPSRQNVRIIPAQRFTKKLILCPGALVETSSNGVVNGLGRRCSTPQPEWSDGSVQLYDPYVENTVRRIESGT